MADQRPRRTLGLNNFLFNLTCSFYNALFNCTSADNQNYCCWLLFSNATSFRFIYII